MTAPKTPAPRTRNTTAKAAPKPATSRPKPTGLALLREPFPDNQIGKLPKPYYKDSPKGNCRECGGYHGLPAMHVDYVGHAALTDRLLDADPEWTWEPVARDQYGLPLIINGGLWINLTVCGVTRLGFGDSQGKSGPNAIKEAIGDALRNAAMRFGAALDLWHKGDLHAFKEEQGWQEAEIPVDDLPTRDINQEPQAPQTAQPPVQVQAPTPEAAAPQQQAPAPAQNVIYEGTQPVPIETDMAALIHEFEETAMNLPPENRTALGALWKKAGAPHIQSFTTKEQIDKAWAMYDQVKPAPMVQPTSDDAAAQQLRQQQQAAARRHFPDNVPADTDYPSEQYQDPYEG